LARNVSALVIAALPSLRRERTRSLSHQRLAEPQPVMATACAKLERIATLLIRTVRTAN
jgi:hypothetical protein